MGTTMVATTIVGHYAYIANVGDSRLYVVRDRIRQVTKDHSLVGEMVRLGRLLRTKRKTIRTKILLPEPWGQKKPWM